MPELLCPHCLQPLDNGYHGECVHCGRSLENRNPEGALPLGTQLGGKYTVGAYLSADGDGLSYRGVLNAEKRFVLIKEYFPVTLCNGRSASGALMPKEEKEVLFKTSRMDFKDLYDDLHNLTPATGLSTILDVMEENNTVYAVEESEKGMTLSHYLHLRSRTLTPAEARTLLQPIMEGVALLHTSGLIHRGICPDNILLPIDGTARLTGYGTLALRTGGSELKSQLYPGYAAPEQYSVQRSLYRCLRIGGSLLQDGHGADAGGRAPAQGAGQSGVCPQSGGRCADMVFSGAGLCHAAGPGQADADCARADERPDRPECRQRHV